MNQPIEPVKSEGVMLNQPVRLHKMPDETVVCASGVVMLRKKLTYLASPYHHEQPDIRYARYMRVCGTAAILMRRGLFVYSPIAHNDGVAYYGELQTGWDYWREYDTAMLECCKDMLVLILDGWQDSVGIRAEIDIATRLGISISYINEEGNPV